MAASRATADERETRTLAGLYEHDEQIRDARPDLTAIAEARGGASTREILRTVIEHYGDRPALGERAAETAVDTATGRASRRLLPRFDTITYRELGERVEAVAAEWHHDGPAPLGEGDFVALLGAGSPGYVVADLACARLGAVIVALQAGAAAGTLRPLVAETGPRILAVSGELLGTGLDLASTSTTIRRVVVLDHHPEVDDERERVAAARARLAKSGVELVVLAEVIERGRTLASPPYPVADPDRLALLLYTSGSTGSPKGAMYTERLDAALWTADFQRPAGQPVVSVTYMPLSHALGRALLLQGLVRGGTVTFVATSDLSTLFEDFGLVRPTEVILLPRVCELIFQQFQGELNLRAGKGGDRARLESELREEMRARLFGGRLVWTISGGAALSAELRTFIETLIGLPLHDFLGSTESGAVMIDNWFVRPPVLDYKLVDVPELGYFSTDRPYPRGELLLKSATMVPGYYNRPDVTRELFDEDGYYRTGDIMAETAPDHLFYLDRAKNVLKLSQGEFVALSRLDALFATADSVRQIYVHGDSERSYLLAVVVPTREALDAAAGDGAQLRRRISSSIQRVAREAELNSYEIPRDFVVETDPFTVENGLLTGARKLMRPGLKEQYAAPLAALYDEVGHREDTELHELRRGADTRPVLETVLRTAQAVLGIRADELSPGAYFPDLGGDSLSALSFSELLGEILGVDAPVGMLISPANDLRAVARHLESALASGSGRPGFAAVHGADATIVRARDLTLDKFLDPVPLVQAQAPSGLTQTVLLTGANGYLGRFLCLAWLERLAETGGKLVCLVRGSSAEAARARLDDAFDSGDPELLSRFRELANEHLEVLAGDVGQPRLGLDGPTWHRLADTVDVIVHPAALVNHVLPYDQLFGPNVVGTAELIRLAVTRRLKPFTYLSSVAVIDDQLSTPDEGADIRVAGPRRLLGDGYASGYAASKWAGEVLLREAHDATGLPVAVFRSDLILAHTRYGGQLNVPDMFTRLLISLIVTGIAPPSFYTAGGPKRARPHYDGLPVDFTAEAIATLGADATTGYETYNLLNSHDDGISLDVFVDWLVEAGHPIRRMGSYAEWFERLTTALRALPENRQQHSLLPLMTAFAEPAPAAPGPPSGHFRAAVRAAGVGPGKDVPHLTQDLIRKYVTDLTRLGLL